MPSPGYYTHHRKDIISLIPPGTQKILEVGCGTGGTASELRKRGVQEIIGIEINEWAGEKAKTQFDRVIIGDVDEVSKDMPNAYFDLILYSDVLEHLVDPWKTLASHKRLIKSKGYILLSIPNVRHWRVLYNLVIRGRWSYRDEGGILDRSHLRFFTRYELLKMIYEVGYEPVNEGHNEFGTFISRIDRMSAGILRGFIIWQHFILARML